MTEKNTVKVTVEYNGETDTFESDAAFIVGYIDKGDGFDLKTILCGKAQVGDMGQAIADAVCAAERDNNKGLEKAVSASFILNSLLWEEGTTEPAEED